MKSSSPKFFSALAVAAALLFGSCGGNLPFGESPYAPSPTGPAEAEGPWEEVLSSDSGYPGNVYLTDLIDYNFGLVGVMRRSDTVHYDFAGYPLVNEGACGPPEGIYPSTYSHPDAEWTALGSGGWAVWRFNPSYRIVNNPGDDFITFSNHNVFGGNPDNSWNELGRVYIAEYAEGVALEDLDWYENSAAEYVDHPNPGHPDNGYDWDAVRGLHGNNHTWANFRVDTQAEFLDSDHYYSDLLSPKGLPVTISRYFTPNDPNLGGDRFDLADFVHTDTGEPWPVDGKMSYLKIVDAPEIVDGQDWNPDWMTGTRVMAAMGINVESYTGAP